MRLRFAERILQDSRRCCHGQAAARWTKGALFQGTQRCRPPPCTGRDLHWSSFLNNLEAGNSRGLSREFPQFRNNAKAEAAASAAAVAWA